VVVICYWATLLVTTATANHPPNVIFILADDLGFGDLGWVPFNSQLMAAVRTPNLLRMAQAGKILTNFHAASPICSPSRAAIMTGLFPWRVGVDFIYSQDVKKDGSEELDHEQLPLVPNIPMTFQHYGYYTAHVGKWHLGEDLTYSSYVYAARLIWLWLSLILD
jgi:arylsulfatase A-like enzyme